MNKTLTSLLFVIIMIMAFTQSCQCQPKDDYEIYSSPVQGATKYHFFLEKKSANPYQLTEGMDYLSPDVTGLKVGESNTPIFTVNLNNDGEEYKVGVVAENLAGYYGGMGTAIGVVGTVPSVPGTVGFRKKQ